jgi:hypothetical protein
MNLGERKCPSSDSEIREACRYVEPLSDARTPHGNRRVSARRGRAGKKSDFFNSLQGRLIRFPQEESRLEEKSTR